MSDPDAPCAAGIAVARGADVASILAAIQSYWTTRGAEEVARDPRRCPALSVEQTGRIGYGVQRSGDWIRVLDSERDTCDPELAAYLHAVLSVPVVAFAEARPLGRAWFARHEGGSVHVLRGDAARHALAAVPGARVPMPAFEAGVPYRVEATLCIDGVPATEGAAYRGPAPETREGRTLRHRWAARRRRACDPAFGAYLRDHPDLAEVQLGDLHQLDQRRPEAVAFVQALAPQILAVTQPAYGKRARVALAEAAFRSDDAARFDEVMATLAAPTRAWHLEKWLAALAAEGDHRRAMAAWAHLHHDHVPSDASWNNLCFVLAQCDRVDWPASLDDLLATAATRGPHNPFVFHNLAVVHLRRHAVEPALDAVAGALAHGYPLLERLREDDDLAPLHDHPRWEALWAAHDARESDAEPPARPVFKTILPGVGFELEGVGRMNLDDDIEELEARLGPTTNDMDAAHGVYRFEQAGVTVGMVYGTYGQLHHLAHPGRTTVAGVDLVAAPAATTAARLAEALDAVPETRRDDWSCRWSFPDADLELWRRLDDPDDAPASTLLVMPKGRLRAARQRDTRARQRQGRLQREWQAKQAEERLARLRACFDARSP